MDSVQGTRSASPAAPRRTAPPNLAAGRRERAHADVSATVVRDLASLDALEADWRDLERRAAGSSFFAGFDWTRAWWTNFGNEDGSSLAVIAARRSGRLVAVLPLLVDRFGPYAWATFAGCGSGRYAAMLVDAGEGEPGPLHDALWTAVRDTGADTLVVDNVSDHSPLAAFLAGRRRIVGAETRSYEIHPDQYAGFDAYLASRPSGFAKGLRRRRRRLAEVGPVRYEVVTDPQDTENVAEAIVDLKLAWLAERGLHGRFLGRRRAVDWLREIGARAGDRLHLSVLKVGEHIAAAQYAFIDDRRLTCYFAAFDVRFSAQSAGKLHFEDLAREAFAAGRDLDLMPPADDYKREWGTPGTPACSMTVPITPLGSVAALVHNAPLRERLKRLYLAMPPAVRAVTADRLQRGARWLARALRRGNKASSSRDLSSEERRP